MKKIRKRIQKNIDFKIFSNIKNKESRCIKVLGFKVFEKSVKGNFCVQEFLGNLVYTEKLRTDVKETKVVKIFNERKVKK